MDEKHIDHEAQQASPPALPKQCRTPVRRSLLPALLSIVLLWMLYSIRPWSGWHCSGKPGMNGQLYQPQAELQQVVQLEASIMSKCPDAQYCLQHLIVPTMAEVSDKVNFTLSYIARIDPSSDVVSCMHGPGECLGNLIQLCAAQLYPDPKLYLGFANCMIADYQDIPDKDLVKDCALEHGLDFENINNCISDEGRGIDLLRQSAQRNIDNGVAKSCTVRLNGKTRCIRDGGQWYDCPGGSGVKNLVKDIVKLASG